MDNVVVTAPKMSAEDLRSRQNMQKFLIGAFAALSPFCVSVAEAGENRSLGWGRLFTNDILGDGEDRWRTGGYSISNIRGKDWSGSRPTTMGEVIEYRLRTEVIAPESIFSPDPLDRRYAGIVTFGAHTHWQRNDIEMNLGVDLVIAGPQTKMSDLHEELHDLVGGPTPRVDNASIDNIIMPTLIFEAAKPFKTSEEVVFRPFVELQAGIETLARIGGDVTFGSFGNRGLRLRDQISGQRYTGIYDDSSTGLSFMAGADVAYIADSHYLDTPGIVKEDFRARVRVGVTHEWELGAFFYGATYLSPEFEAQSTGQVVGSINARFQF
jgi:hypothetical protein